MRHTSRLRPRALRLCPARRRLPAGTALAVATVGLVAVPAYGVQTADTGAERLEVRPTSVVPGSEVAVGTVACGPDGTATGDASSVGASAFTLAPGTPAGTATGRFSVPSSAQPGTYEIVVRCSEEGEEVAGDLVVSLTGAAERTHPRGSMKTGVGGALGDPVQTAAGVAALAVAAAGGTWLLHRRARGEGI